MGAELVDEDLAGMRVNYGAAMSTGGLTEQDLADGWAPLLRKWIHAAAAGGVFEPNAMTLATVDIAGNPVTRTVLCKAITDAGVVFYTNHDSDKGRQLHARPRAAVTFAWPRIACQVSLRGAVRQVDPEVTAAYWARRPRGSQLGAWASRQSVPIGSRTALAEQYAQAEARFADIEQIPVPPNWGGYELVAEVAEFWHGQPDRLHDRFRLTLVDDRWGVQRLQP